MEERDGELKRRWCENGYRLRRTRAREVAHFRSLVAGPGSSLAVQTMILLDRHRGAQPQRRWKVPALVPTRRRRRKKVEQGSKAVSEPEQAESGGVVSLPTAVLMQMEGEEAQNEEMRLRRKGSERKRKGESDELASAVPFADLKAGLRGVCTRRRGLHLCVCQRTSSEERSGPEARVQVPESQLS